MKLLHFPTDFAGRPPRPMLRGKVYYIRQRIAGRDVWRSLHTRDKREAEYLALEIWRARQTDPVKSIIPVPPRKLELVWENYRASDRFTDLADSTRDTKRRTWAAFSAWCKAHRIEYPEQLTEDLAVSYLSSGDRKNKTFNNILNDLRQVFQFGGASCNVFETVRPLPTHRGKQEKRSEAFRAFTDAEMERIFRAIQTSRLKHREEWYVAAKIASMTGLRYKDVALLRRDSLKEDGRGKYLELAPAKTDSRTGGRVVFIRLVPELAELLTVRMAGGRGEYVLPNLAAEYPRKWVTATHPFSRLCERIGVKGTFHCFRVTVITKAAAAGINLEEFGGVVGHSSEKQTQAYNRAALFIDMERVLSTRLDG